MASAIHPDLQIAQIVAETYDDPLGFVQLAYPWGEPGELAGFAGPDRWQSAFLEDLSAAVRARGFDGIHAVAPIRMATASGHGIGKSTLVAWIVDWIMSTRPNCQGTITANTYTQLETKTWAAIQKWTRMCVTGSWFQSDGEPDVSPALSPDLVLLGAVLPRGKLGGICGAARCEFDFVLPVR